MAKNRFEKFLFGMDVYRGEFTQAKMITFLGRVRAYVDSSASFERHHDAMQLLIAQTECQLGATTDSAAEAMRRGYNLGLCLAVYDRREFYRSVQSSNQAQGIKTRAKEISTRNNNLVADYHTLESKEGCLPARRMLRSKYERTLTRINQILEEKGITINRKR